MLVITIDCSSSRLGGETEWTPQHSNGVNRVWLDSYKQRAKIPPLSESERSGYGPAVREDSENRTTGLRLHGLDALRGIAAFWVVLMHAHVLFPMGIPDISPKGYLAVDFFFVLSGYVMARTYEPRMRNGLEPAKFFTARLKRLWPTMALGGLLFLPYLAEGSRGEIYDPVAVIALNLLLLPSPWTNNAFPLNVPAWSIFYELVANLVHAALLWRRSTRLVISLAVISFFALLWFVPKLGSLDIGAHKGELLAGLARVGFTYCLGIILWRTWGERRLPAIVALPALLFMPWAFAQAPADLARWWQFDLGFIVLAAPLLLIAGLSMRRGAILAKLGGELSFPLYATHYPTLYWCRDAGMGAISSMAACVVVAGVVAGLQLAWTRHRASTRRLENRGI